MGADCSYTIPAPARLQDVAEVAGALLGCTVTREPLGRDSFYAKVHGVTYRHIDNLYECVGIEFPSSAKCSLLYHYEWDQFGNHGIMPRSRARNVALCIALCDFFGGTVDFNDCDDSKIDYSAPVQTDIHATNGDEWEAFQNRKLAVRPLTKEQIAFGESVAAYKED